MNFRHRHLSSEKGFALVLTLLILVLITAMVVEFAYGVYTSTSALHNWKEAQKLSFVSKSGVSLAMKFIREWRGRDELYKYLGQNIPFENVMEGFDGRVVISAEDENGKFNLNSLRLAVSQTAFRNLLKNLGLDESIADRVAYWISRNSVPGLMNSQEVTKDSNMDSVDELLLIRGVDLKTYEALLPHVTVYSYRGVGSGSGVTDDARVNINTASIPVIMSLAEISRERAETLVNQRKLKPFSSPGEAANIGINLPTTLFGADTPSNFRITSLAEENGIRRVIESVVSVEDQKVRYWREM